MARLPFKVGDEIHGFASGAFGRDSYICRIVEAVGPDWAVTRNILGDAEFLTAAQADGMDPADLSHCDYADAGECVHADDLARLREGLPPKR